MNCIGSIAVHFPRLRRSSIVIAFFLPFSLTLLGSSSALAYSCPAGYYYAGQETDPGDVNAMQGYVTDPVASTLPGDSSNHFYHDHILLDLTELEANIPSGQPDCGFGYSICWMQAGVGMGDLDGQYNDSDLYEPYFENAGPDNYMQWNYLTGYGLAQGSSIKVHVYYDGTTGRGGWPQFKAYVNGTYLGEDVLYYGADHALAEAEVETINSSSCPTLTDGSPWQNFGTDSSGNPTSGTELEIAENNGPYKTWDFSVGSDTVDGYAPYYYADLAQRAAFRTNGPSSGPA